MPAFFNLAQLLLQAVSISSGIGEWALKKISPSTSVPLPAVWLYLLHFSQRQICDRFMCDLHFSYCLQLTVSIDQYGLNYS